MLRFIPRLLQKSHKEQEIRTEMKEHLKRKLWKRNCLLIFSIFLFVTLVVIFSQNQYQNDIPPLDVKKSSSEGWALTGEISHIYGVVNSYTDFFEHGWIEAENSRNLQFSEFKPLHENYCLFYGEVDLMNLRFLEKESGNYTMRAIINQITGETYINVFGR